MRTTWARTRSTVMSRRLEDARSEALLLAQQAEQDVLGADVIVLENPGLLLGEDDHLPGPFGEALKHAVLSYLSGTAGAALPRSFPLDRHLRRSPERCTRTPARCGQLYQRPQPRIWPSQALKPASWVGSEHEASFGGRGPRPARRGGLRRRRAAPSRRTTTALCRPLSALGRHVGTKPSSFDRLATAHRRDPRQPREARPAGRRQGRAEDPAGAARRGDHRPPRVVAADRAPQRRGEAAHGRAGAGALEHRGGAGRDAG